MIYTISDRYGFRGPSRHLEPGDGYRIIYVPSKPVGPDQLLDLGNYIEPAVAPCEYKGAILDGDELEITIRATSACAAKTTRWLYDQVVGAVEAFVNEQPVPVPQPNGGSTGGGSRSTALQSWMPYIFLGGIFAVAFWMAKR